MSQKRKLVMGGDEPISNYDHWEEAWFDEKTADVYFIIDSKDTNKPIRIPAHKNKLASTSDVFNVMFFGGMAEKGDVRVVDVSVDIFKIFLRFFYDCNVALTMENISDVTNMCNKYNVIHGLEECDTFLKSVMSCENIIDIYELAITFERRKLRRICEVTIQMNIEAVFHSNCFLECKKFVLSHILDLNLMLCTEADIFKACISWTKTASELEELTKEAFAQHFGELLYKIRFPSMPPKDFVGLSRRYGYLIPADVYREIAQAVLSGGSFEATNFSKEPRQIRWNKDAIIVCDRTVKQGAKCLNSFHDSHMQTTLSSNEPLLLGEFAIELINFPKVPINTSSGISECSVVIAEVNRPYNTRGKILQKVSKAITTTNDALLEIEFPKPVLIRPGIFYSIFVNVVIPMRLQFLKFLQMKNAVKLDDGVTINFHDKKLTFSDEMYGFIPVLRFNRL